jgi:hypothetical protein
MKAPLNTLLFGGCLLHWPLKRTAPARGKLALREYGKVKEVHTFGEMVQIIEVLRGEKIVPRELKYLAHMSPRLTALPEVNPFADLDLALLEPASPIELTLRGVAVNRFAINRFVRAQFADADREANNLAAKWLRHGLIGLDETTRLEAGTKLLDHIHGQSDEAELARAIVRETRASQGDIIGGFHKMRELLACPMGVALYVFRYMPDGRTISLPLGFREAVLEAAQQLRLPIFDPSPLVISYGVQAALGADQGHYSEEFLPIAGEALVKFAQSVYEGSQSKTVQ